MVVISITNFVDKLGDSFQSNFLSEFKQNCKCGMKKMHGATGLKMNVSSIQHFQKYAQNSLAVSPNTIKTQTITNAN